MLTAPFHRTFSLNLLVCRCVAAAAVLTWLLPMTASGQQDVYAQQARTILDAIGTELSAAGYTQVHSAAGSLSEGESADHSVFLTAGQYVITAVCDQDCSDVDLTVRDASGATLSDTEDDDTPVVEFAIDSGGQFVLTVHMWSCSNAPCYYALGSYRNPSVSTGPGFGASGGAGPVAGEASAEWQVAAQRIANDYLRNMAARGTRLVLEELVTGSLWAGEGDLFDFIASAGSEYMVVGFCDGDCRDIDLFLYSPEGDAVDSDTEDDANPVVLVDGDGRLYDYEVTMHGCAVGPCGFGVMVLRRQGVPGTSP